MANCDDAYGFPPYPVIQDFLHSRNGADLRGAERRTTASALTAVPATLLQSSTMDWWQRLPAFVAGDARRARRWGPAEEAIATVEAADE